MTMERHTKRLNSLRMMKEEVRAKDVHKILLDDTIWYDAYSNIYSNKGAFSKGSDKSDTLDNFSKERISKIIASLKDMSYQCKPARRVNIPKPNGKTRPLGIPCGTDKLVQEACRIILEAIYEPKFSDSSHGFRTNRSCHTALQKVSTWAYTKWWIEFDIKGCFDNIDHAILIKLLEKRIDDRKFLGLIRKFLNAGYIEDFRYNNTFSGTPQGGIISPILSNIYLNELDKYADSLCNLTNDNKIKNFRNKEYFKYRNLITNGNKSIELYQNKYNTAKEFIVNNIANKNHSTEVKKIFDECFKLKEQKKYNNVLDKCVRLEKLLNLDRLKLYNAFNVFDYEEKIKTRRLEIIDAEEKLKHIRSTEINEEFERLHYVRYADDFIFGYIGTKEEAYNKFEIIKLFLKEHLKLDISESKSKVVHGSDGITFLGYKIEMPSNTGSRTTFIKDGSEITRSRNLARPVFKVPTERMIEFVGKRGYGSYVENESTGRTTMQNLDEIEIIKQYNAELRGLVQYYKHAMNFKNVIGKVQWLWQYSLLKTFAAKHRSSVAGLFRSKIIKVKLTKDYKKIWYIGFNDKDYDVFNIRDIEYINMINVKPCESNDIEFIWIVGNRSGAVQKLMADECELCGIKGTETKIILHHPNQIRHISNNIPKFERLKRMRNRKVIALCHNCHMEIHHCGK